MSTLELLKELEAKATPARWRYRDMDEIIIKESDSHQANPRPLFHCYDNEKLQSNENDWSDVLLVMHMRNALPKLLAVVDAAKRVNNSAYITPNNEKGADEFNGLADALMDLDELEGD